MLKRQALVSVFWFSVVFAAFLIVAFLVSKRNRKLQFNNKAFSLSLVIIVLV